MDEKSVYEIVREAEQNLTSGVVHQGKYVDFSMFETIQTIDAYLNSKHISGLNDSLGREKPFFNIVTSATNIWYRATDIDRKDIRVLPSKTNQIGLAYLATIHLQRWMDKNNFGKFLNLWGRTLARYGSAVVKFVEQGDELIPTVVSWNRFIADPIDFDAIPHIEKFYKTPAQLRKIKEYDPKMIDALCDAQVSRKGLDGQSIDNSNNFIEIYEIHGELSVADYKKAKGEEPKEGDDDIFKQQMHVVSFVATDEKDSSGNTKYNDFTLYCGYEKQDPYMITHLIEEDGRTLAIGAVEYLFDAQWMQNHTIKQWKDQLDLASKLIFQTADRNYFGKNVLTQIEQGDIFIHAPNMPLTMVNNQGHDSASMQSFSNLWKVLGQEITSTPESVRGITPPSGTALGTVQINTAQGLSLFELMTENKGLYIEQMLKTFVIPHLKKGLDTDEEVIASLEEQGLYEIDSIYIPNQAVKNYNERVKKEILSGMPNGVPSPFMPEMEQNAVKQSLTSLGNKRPFKPTVMKNGKEVDVTWKEVFSDFEWDNLKVEVTNENKDKMAVLQTLTSLYQTLAQTDPQKANVVLGKLMSETGTISPMELGSMKSQPVNPATVGAGSVAGISGLVGKQ